MTTALTLCCKPNIGDVFFKKNYLMNIKHLMFVHILEDVQPVHKPRILSSLQTLDSLGLSELLNLLCIEHTFMLSLSLCSIKTTSLVVRGEILVMLV